VDAQSDTANCGGCGNACSTWAIGCSAGKCDYAEVNSKRNLDTDSLSFTLDVTGSSRLLLVGVAEGGDAGVQTTGVTFEGKALTKVDEDSVDNHSQDLSLWMLKNPRKGTGKVLVSLSSSQQVAAGAMQFAGVDLDDPFGSVVTAKSNSHEPRFSTEIPSKLGELAVNVVTSADPLVPGSTLTLLYDKASLDKASLDAQVCAGAVKEFGVGGGGGAGGMGGAGGAGSSTKMDWRLIDAESWVSIGVSLRPAP
jgi:hypothetical protein